MDSSAALASTATDASAKTAKAVMLVQLIPEGVPQPEHFEIVEMPSPTCSAEGDFVLEVLAMSPDPYMRGAMKRLGEGESLPRALRGFVAGKVVESRNERWPVGSLMGASLPMCTLQLVTARELEKTVSWDLTPFIAEERISLGVGLLGMPGATAYGGFIDVLKAKEGETLFVSAAAGAVGSMVGQIAKNIYGCTVIGSCGGPKKGELIKERYGFDHAIDYKAVEDAEALAARLRECAPSGINMYFENVGGMHFEAAMATLAPYGRVALCGCISGYGDKELPTNRINIAQMIYTFQRVEGFVCMPWLSGRQGNFLKDMSRWVEEGKLQLEETSFDGIEQWPEAFASLFTGANIGKVVVRT